MSEYQHFHSVLGQCKPDYCSNDMAIIDDIRRLHIDAGSIIDNVLLIFVRSGYMYIDINGEHLQVSPAYVLMCRPGLEISSPTYSDDFSGHGILLTMRYSQSIISVAGNIWNYLISIDSRPIIRIPPSVRTIMLEYYNLLKLEVYHSKNAYYDEVVSSIVRSMLYSLINDVRQLLFLGEKTFTNFDNNYKGSKQALALFHGFLDILLTDQCMQRKIEFYAQRLCVTPKYLSTVCRQVSNRTAHEWICDALVNNINKELRYSSLSIKEIANKYGFTTLSFFSKFVKDHLGKTPSEIRKL